MPENNPVHNKLIKDLGAGNRAWKALDRAGYQTIGQLVDLDAHDLMDIRGFGLDCLIKVTDCLTEMGLALKPSNFRYRS